MRKRSSFVQVVPWRNREEWLQVYDKLYSHERDDLEWAVHQVSAWQARCPTSTLLGVETTAGLVKARLSDLNQSTSDEAFDRPNDVSMVYAMAIVRFVNLVCETGKSRSHVTPIRNIARGMGIPEWLINLRHSSTHRHKIPSLDMLRTGSSLALEWLRLNYWEREKDNLHNVIQGTQNQNNVMEKIENCLHEYQNVQYAVLYGQNRKVLKMNRANLQSVLSRLRKILKKHPYSFVHVLSESGYLIPKYHHLEALLKPGEKDFLNSSSIQLPLSLEKFWSPVFALFSHNDNLQCLLKFLLEPHNDNDFLERLSSAWSLHILNIVSSQEPGVFQFKTSLNWVQLLEIALKKPNQYSQQVLTAISENVPMNEDTKEALMTLAAIYLGSVSSSTVPKKFDMHGLDDLTKLLPHKDKTTGLGPWSAYNGKCEWQKMPLGFEIWSTKQVPVTDNSESTIANENGEKGEPVITEPIEILVDEFEEEKEYAEESKSEETMLKETELSSSLIFM